MELLIHVFIIDHIKGYYTNLTSTGLEDLHISGSTRGSLSALKKWY